MGFITDALGLTDFAGQERAEKKADEAFALAKENNENIKKYGQQEIEFFLDQYNKWNDIFGGNFDDLGTYFKNLTGDTWAAKNAVAIQQQVQKANSQINTTMAQRGLQDTGIATSLTNQNIMQGAIAKANVFANADEYVAQQKMGFASLGLQQQGMLLQGINNSYNSTLSALGGISSGYINTTNNQAKIAAELSKENTGMVDNIVGGITRGWLGGLFE